MSAGGPMVGDFRERTMRRTAWRAAQRPPNLRTIDMALLAIADEEVPDDGAEVRRFDEVHGWLFRVGACWFTRQGEEVT